MNHRLAVAIDRMDRALATLQMERVMSYAEMTPAGHVLGCSLRHDHEGDCMVPRYPSSRTIRVAR